MARLIGRYRVVSEVAQGGMGVVYRGRGPDDRDVALKLLLAGQTATPLQRRRMLTEIQTQLRLRHPHVVGLLDAGEHEGTPWLAMEWVEGETLAERLEREGPLDPRLAVQLLLRLCAAIEHCHAMGVLHRDLKPHNVLLRAGDGAPLLTDFGLAKDDEEDEDDQSTSLRTVQGRLLGSPGYWPPEQARGELGAIDARSDVYGLGAILYACLTGVAPQAGVTLQELLAASYRPPKPPGARRRGIPAAIEAVCLRALEIDPARRQSSARELGEELEAALQAKRPRSRGKWTLTAALLLLGLGGGAAAAQVALRSSPEDPAEACWARGVEAARRGERALALAEFERALQLDPRSATALRGRAVLRAEAGDLPAARADLDRAIELDPGAAPSWYDRAIVRGKQADPDGALADLDAALRLDPDYVDALVMRGVVHKNCGALPLARVDLERAVALDPLSAGAHVNLGLVLSQLGEPAAAAGALERAIELAPRSAMAYFNRGVLRAQAGERAAALEDFSRAIELDPALARARFNRAVERLQSDDLAGAREDLDRVIELTPLDPEGYRQRAVVRERLRDSPGALSDLQRFLELAPAHPHAPAARRRVERLRAASAPR